VDEEIVYSPDKYRETEGIKVKTIISRITRVSELGAEEVSKIQGAYAELGIQIMKNENEFKDFGTILELLDEKWDSLTQVQKRYISELSAGVIFDLPSQLEITGKLGN